MHIAVVIPVYNEGKKINEVLDTVTGKYQTVIVINDGSSDDTAEVLANRLRDKNDITILTHIINRGQGAALRAGTNYALKIGADIIAHFDADGQHDVKYIDAAVTEFKNKSVDVVIGTRFSDIKNDIPLFRNISLHAAKVYMRIIGGVSGLTDPQNGFRVLSRNAAKQITINQDRMAHCSEIIIEVNKKKLPVTEIPMYVPYTDYSRQKSDDSITRAINITKELLLAKLLK